MQSAPAFGQADLSNCERELIHLAGSVQPHGALLVLAGADLRVLQLSGNVARLLGVAPDALLQRPLAVLGGDVAERVAQLQQGADLREAVALQCRLGAAQRRFDGALHRLADGSLVLELEPAATAPDGVELQDLAPDVLAATLSTALQRFGAAPSVGVLADAVVEVVRHLTGYDRVVVYKFDPDGHGKVSHGSSVVEGVGRAPRAVAPDGALGRPLGMEVSRHRRRQGACWWRYAACGGGGWGRGGGAMHPKVKYV